MQAIIEQPAVTRESLVLFHVGAVPYAGVVVSVLSPALAIVRVQTRDGLKEVEIAISQLSTR